MTLAISYQLSALGLLSFTFKRLPFDFCDLTFTFCLPLSALCFLPSAWRRHLTPPSLQRNLE
jgi:hypothetical protein